MKIDFPNIYKNYNQYNYTTNNNNNFIKKDSLSSDTFTKSSNVKSKPVQFTGLIQNTASKFFRDFSIEEYSKLGKKEIETLRAKYVEKIGSSFDKDLKLHDLASDMIKKVFDETYGENNYVVITIGRSLSSIGKVLGYKIGENNVINVPFSKASRFNTQYPASYYIDSFNRKMTRLTQEDKPDNLIQFLKSKGLTKENVESSKKHYIIMDYCLTGYSLDGANNLFKSNFIFGNKNHNIHSADIIEVLESCNINGKKADKMIADIDWWLQSEKYKPLSLVKKSPRLQDTMQSQLSSSNLTEDNQLILFKLLDETLTNNNKNNITMHPYHSRSGNHVSWKIPIKQLKDDISDDAIDINNLMYKCEMEYTKKNISKSDYDAIKSKLKQINDEQVKYLDKIMNIDLRFFSGNIPKDILSYYDKQKNIHTTIEQFRKLLQD